MVKPTIKKIISGVIMMAMIFTFILPLSYTAEAVGTKQLNWENPNKSGSNPFKFKLKDSLDSNLIMSVIGCTGVVNKISKAVTGFVQKKINKKITAIKNKVVEKASKGAIDAGLGVTAATSTSPGSHAGTGLATIGEGAASDVTTKKTSDSMTQDSIDNVDNTLNTQENTQNCLNGIAYTLAKNQLTAMTKSTMNWVTSGFGGDPMYVQNMNSFMNNITGSILEKELSVYNDLGLYPYGSNYARGAVGSYKSSMNFANSMKQNLTNYLNFGGLGNDAASLITGKTTPNANLYYNNFGAGGWDGWLAFTQIPQNNPLGFNIKMTQDIANKQETQKEQTKTELVTNKGVLDQKKCVKYAKSLKSAVNSITASKSAADANYNTLYDAYLRAESEYNDIVYTPTRFEEEAAAKQALLDAWTAVEDASSVTALNSDGTPDDCVEWQVITPGSVIQDKISTYVNSPERQLELADTINKSLNALFTALISKLQHEGLSSLGSNIEDFSNGTGGIGANKIYDTSGTDITQSLTTASGFSGPFDITKDLGNLYTKPVALGYWDASTNKTDNIMEPYLSIGVGTKNSFYEVSVAGNKSLFEGNTSWTKGERAFFDGETWKKGVPTYVLEKKGILQNQQDYINNAQKVLKVIPKTMPAIGELEYCIPGPNQNWQANTSDAYSAYTDWLYGIGEDQKAKAFLVRPKTRIVIPDTTSLVYRAYKKIFDNTGLWQSILNSPFFNSYIPNGSVIFKDWTYAPFDRYNHSCNGSAQTWWKGNDCIGRALEVTNKGQQKWIDFLDTSSKLYITKSNDLFWSNKTETMNNPFSSSYIEMAQTGLAITKNIVDYSNNIDEATINYQDAIIESCSNIYKLNKIKEEVNQIVKAAQDRRKAKGIVVDPSCMETEQGSYMIDDKVVLKGCGNTIIEETPEMQLAKKLEAERLAQEAIDAATTAAAYAAYDAEAVIEGVGATANTATTSTPAVINIPANYIQSTSAIVGGDVINLGVPAVVSGRGVCYYSEGSSPSNATCLPTSGSTSTGIFSIQISSLTPATKYNYYAYAENSTGRSSVPWSSFTTLAATVPAL